MNNKRRLRTGIIMFTVAGQVPHRQFGSRCSYESMDMPFDQFRHSKPLNRTRAAFSKRSLSLARPCNKPMGNSAPHQPGAGTAVAVTPVQQFFSPTRGA